MAPAQGDSVRVHYRGTLADGTEFDSSKGREPLEFKIGEGQVIPGFETAVQELEVGASATFTIPAADAYGEHSDEALREVPRAAFEQEPQAGWMIELAGPNGERIQALIAEVRDETVVLDFNHPLAGQDLTFEVELVEIVE